MFPTQITFEQLHDFQEQILGLSKVAHDEAGNAKVETCRHLERDILKRLDNSLGVLAERKRFLGRPVAVRWLHI